MKLPRALANGLWCLACLPESVAYRRALGNVAAAQRTRLLAILRANADTEFGRAHGFSSIRDVAEYRRRVPLSSYDEYGGAIEAVCGGRERVLTAERVLLVEPTSGSTAATKYIPYTASLKREFQRGIAPWIFDLYRSNPRLLLGESYWSVTPVTHRGSRTSGGLPIGFEDDAEYLGPIQRLMAGAIMAVPNEVRSIADMDAFRYATLLFLLRSRALSLVSVWNPTFLTLLLARLDAWWPRLADDIAAGTLDAPGAIDAGVRAALAARLAPDARRAEEVRGVFASCADAQARYAHLWPRLRVVSCWADANAGSYARDVRRLFPNAFVQGKGLLATEGFISLPVSGREGAALALRSHFLEFLPVDGGGALGAHELEAGRCYTVAITTGGGLYRYRLGDLVEVINHIGECPLVKFAGREDLVSDWFGEKVNDRHVRRALDAVCAQLPIRPEFAMLSCEPCGPGESVRAYTLFIEASTASASALDALAVGLEAHLRENYHYAYCRDLGQLDAVRVVRVASNGLEAYLDACIRRGQRAGDVKPAVLHTGDGWLREFAAPAAAGLNRCAEVRTIGPASSLPKAPL